MVREETKARIEKLRGGKKIRKEILLVEDKEEDRLVVKSALLSCGYDVPTVSEARNLTRFLSSRPMSWIPEAVVLDLVLDGSSGYQVLRDLRARFDEQGVPLVVLSKLATEEDIYEAQRAGADAFIGKPFMPQDLLDVIAFCMENLRKPITERKTGICVKRPANS